MKKLLALMLAAALALSLAACGGKPAVQSKDDVLNEVTDIYNWLVGDIWNKGFCDISSYYVMGTSSTGDELDIEFTLTQLDKAMEKKADYDAYMEGLSDEFKDLSGYWVKVSEQVDILYAEVKERTPETTGEGLESGLYEQYFDAFMDELLQLEKD